MADPQKHSIDGLSTTVPLYIQIAETLIEQIETGALAPGDRLLSERELSTQFGVNRMTLRQALRLLESRGLVVRRQGDGTYVSQPKVEQKIGQWLPFTAKDEPEKEPRARLLSINVKPADTSIARELKLTTGAPVYAIVRLRLVNQQPIVLERFFVPAERFPGLDTFDLNVELVYNLMRNKYDTPVKWVRQSVEPTIATEYEAKLLGIAEGAPLLLERRNAFDENHQPIEYGHDLYRGDRIRFVTETLLHE